MNPVTTEQTRGIPEGTPVGAIVPQVHGGAIRNGGTNAGNPLGAKSHIRNNVRQAAREILNKRSLRVLTLLQSGRGVKLPDGRRLEVQSGHVIAAIRLLYEIGYGQEAIPEALIAACAGVFIKLPELLNRPELTFNPDELKVIARALDEALGNAKVK